MDQWCKYDFNFLFDLRVHSYYVLLLLFVGTRKLAHLNSNELMSRNVKRLRSTHQHNGKRTIMCVKKKKTKTH